MAVKVALSHHDADYTINGYEQPSPLLLVFHFKVTLRHVEDVRIHEGHAVVVDARA